MYKNPLTRHNNVHTVIGMEISYDPTQNGCNIADRSLSFERAADFDFETAVIWVDGRVHSLVFVETGNGIRVISFRKANKREVKRYEQETQSCAD